MQVDLQLLLHTMSQRGNGLCSARGLCDFGRATVNGNASDMNSSQAAGRVWGEGKQGVGGGSEYLMHPATTQQFALKSLLPI